MMLAYGLLLSVFVSTIKAQCSDPTHDHSNEVAPNDITTWKQLTIWDLKKGQYEWTLCQGNNDLENFIFVLNPANDNLDKLKAENAPLFSFASHRVPLKHGAAISTRTTSLYGLDVKKIDTEQTRRLLESEHPHEHDHGHKHDHDEHDGHKHDEHEHDHGHKHGECGGHKHGECGRHKHEHDHDEHDHGHKDGECGGHGHAHGNKCHCDKNYEIDPENAMNCIPMEDHYACDINTKLDPTTMKCIEIEREDSCNAVLIAVNVAEDGKYALFSQDTIRKAGLKVHSLAGEEIVYTECIDGCPHVDSDLTNTERWLFTVAACLVVSLTSLLSIILLLFKRKVIMSLLDVMTSFATGALISTVTFHIYPEANEYLQKGHQNWELGLCVLAGIVLGMVMEQGLHLILSRNGVIHHHHHHEHEEECTDEQVAKDTYHNNLETPAVVQKDAVNAASRIKPVAWIVAFGDFTHAYTDGVLIAIGFRSCSSSMGWMITLAIILHEIPHRLGDFFIFLKAGMTVKEALVLNFMASLSTVLGAIILLAVGDVSNATLGYLLGVGSGTLLFIAMAELLPTMMHEMKPVKAGINFFVFSLGAVIIGLTMLDHKHCHVNDD